MIYDFIAIGVGPFNLGLACLTQPIEELNGLFLERKTRFDWHPGMLIGGASLQTPFLGDLVTLADPTSRFSYLNYAKLNNSLYSFYRRENLFLFRSEYNQYCQWAAEQLPNVLFDRNVERIDYDADTRCYEIVCRDEQNQRYSHRARKLVVGTGPAPHIPQCCKAQEQRATHSSTYLTDKAELQDKQSITLVGSGQSAAEIFYDLLQDSQRHDYRLDWITRSPRFFPLELTKLTLELTSPDYAEYFFNLPMEERDRLNASQASLYKGIDSALINEIYDLLYRLRLEGPLRVNLHTNTELTGCAFDAKTGRYDLACWQREQRQSFAIESDALVLATGYRHQRPAFLKRIEQRIRYDRAGRFDVSRNYGIGVDDDIFVQNAELHTHGFVTPDLGMACYRNAWIVRELLGREYYPIERSTTFQTFAAPGMGVEPLMSAAAE